MIDLFLQFASKSRVGKVRGWDGSPLDYILHPVGTLFNAHDVSQR